MNVRAYLRASSVVPLTTELHGERPWYARGVPYCRD
jgi:hypothetical protein